MDFDMLEFDKISYLRILMKRIDPNCSFNIGQEKKHYSRPQGKVFRFRWNSVTFLIDGGVLSPVILPGNNEEGSCLYVQDLFPGDDYVAAIAEDNVDFNISC